MGMREHARCAWPTWCSIESESRDELRADYPELEEEDIRQALAYAAAIVGDENADLPTAS